MEQPRARMSDPETSHEAAESLSEVALTAQKRRILRIVRRIGPCTHKRIIDRYRRDFGDGVSEQSLRSRTAELRRAGALEWAGTYDYSGRTRQREWEALC